MKIFESIKNFDIVICIIDIINFFKFRRQTKQWAKNDKDFKNLGLNVNALGNVVYTQITCSDEDLARHDYSPLDMVMNTIKPHIDFLTDAGWGEYLIPQITNFVDEHGNNSLSYLILFVYSPIRFTFAKLLRFILYTGAITGLIFCIKWFIETYM